MDLNEKKSMMKYLVDKKFNTFLISWKNPDASSRNISFKETYCISALEALMAGCICITSDLGGLTDTIGDRGVLITEPIHSEEYFNKALEQIIRAS